MTVNVIVYKTKQYGVRRLAAILVVYSVHHCVTLYKLMTLVRLNYKMKAITQSCTD
jgi:hypothetical protein